MLLASTLLVLPAYGQGGQTFGTLLKDGYTISASVADALFITKGASHYFCRVPEGAPFTATTVKNMACQKVSE